MLRTKVICTLGPSCDNDEVMRGLLENGMDCARMNFSHGDHAEHFERLSRFRRIRDELGLNTAVLLDTKGPEIRTGDFKEKVTLVEGEDFLISHKEIEGTAQAMSISYKDLHKDIQKGQLILIDDGLVGIRAKEIMPNGDVRCVIENGGEVSSHKSINVPGAYIKLPALTERDESDILFAVENEYDFIAMSFVRSAADVQHVRRLLDQHGGSHIHIISKIENQQGVDNLDEIIRASDGVMVARGDLGVEIPVEEVPVIQKKIIKRCLEQFKIVVVATQMLDSMIRNPRPTRAEASDVANAIFDGATCTMLSGETANGRYSVDALRTMRSIAEKAEASVNYWGRLRNTKLNSGTSITDAISMATCNTAMTLNADCISTVSNSGHTARAISRLHPACPIVCATPDPRVERQLRLCWGVTPVLAKQVKSTDALFNVAIEAAEKTGIVKSGDLLVITAGVPVGVSGTTNTIKVQLVGDILARGRSVGNKASNTTAEILVIQDPAGVNAASCTDKLVVAPSADEKLLPLLRKAAGLILEKDDDEGFASAAALALDIPVVAGAGGSCALLKSGTVLTLEVTEDGTGYVKQTSH